MKKISFLILLCAALFCAGCSSSNATKNQSSTESSEVTADNSQEMTDDEAAVDMSDILEKLKTERNMDDLTKVIFKTSMGNITIALYDNTPLHKENFLKLVKSDYYNDILFHRIIQGFMIQTGDPDSKGAPVGKQLGSGGPDYTIPAEFRKENYHKRGAVAAARQGDNVNPTKASSGSQFYIVDGKKFTKDELSQITSYYGTTFTDEQVAVYTTIGGAPFLDMQYTVFGEVVEGMDVVDKIAAQKKDRFDRPFNDIKIISTQVVE